MTTKSDLWLTTNQVPADAGDRWMDGPHSPQTPNRCYQARKKMKAYGPEGVRNWKQTSGHWAERKGHDKDLWRALVGGSCKHELTCWSQIASVLFVCLF